MTAQLELDFGVCVFSDYDDDGNLQIQTDSPGIDGEEGTAPAQALFPMGVFARPLDPDKGGSESDVGDGASCITVTAGNARYILPLDDPRDLKKLPKIRKGGRMLAGGAGEYRSFVAIDGEDPKKVTAPGSITISASYAKAGFKKSLGISLNVRTPGKEEISLIGGNGQRVTLGEQGVTVVNAAGDAFVTVGEDGNVLAGDSKVHGSLNVGSQVGGQSVPIWPALLQYLTALEAALRVGNVGGPIAVPTSIASLAALIASKHLKTT